MSSSKSPGGKPESRKKRLSRGWRDMFTNKRKESQTLPPDHSHTYESSDADSIQKYDRNPSITVEDASNLPLSALSSGTADAGALAYAHASLHIPSTQSRNSVGSHKSRKSLASNSADSRNE
jgi:hypothetical protein